MNSTTRLSSGLRAAALLALLGTAAVWAATGAHLGWTQTSVVTMQYDQITGIDYPVRQAAFVAGVEVLAAGAAVAALLGGLGQLVFRRSPARA